MPSPAGSPALGEISNDTKRTGCGSQPLSGGAGDTVTRMSAQPADCPPGREPFEVIHLGGEAAAIVPLAELRRLRAIERHAPPQVIEEAEAEAVIAEYREWVAAGRPGALTHEEAMAKLLTSADS